MRPLSAALAKIAKEELNETPERIQQDLDILRVWIRQQGHLRARTTDEFLIAFLRRCRYSLEDTKKRIDNYFAYYKLFPEIMRKRSVNEKILDLNRMGIQIYPELPISEDQTTLLITRLCGCNPKNCNMRDVIQYFSMAMEIVVLENDNASVAGISEVIDMEGIVWEMKHKTDKVFIKKWDDWFRDCAPFRIKCVYFINCSKEMYRVMSLMKVMSSFFKEFPFEVLKAVEDLYKYIPQKYFPEEYGGCNGHIVECAAYLEDLLKSYSSYFEEEWEYDTNEELRGGEVRKYEADFGVNGSFRKLTLE